MIGSRLSNLSCEDQGSNELSGFNVRGSNIMMIASGQSGGGPGH